MNRLQSQFTPEMEKNRTEPDLQTLVINIIRHLNIIGHLNIADVYNWDGVGFVFVMEGWPYLWSEGWVGSSINKVFIGPVCMLELSCMNDGLRLRLFTIRLCLGFSCVLCFGLTFGSTGFGCNRLSWMDQFVACPSSKHGNLVKKCGGRGV
jgi:hypothetical protein